MSNWSSENNGIMKLIEKIYFKCYYNRVYNNLYSFFIYTSNFYMDLLKFRTLINFNTPNKLFIDDEKTIDVDFIGKEILFMWT